MRDGEYNGARVKKYLFWAFALAYAVQIIAARIYSSGNTIAGQLIVGGSMFAPALGVLLSGGGLRDMGWKPRVRKNIRAILFAWLAPMVMTAIGAGLYFLVFPGHFDLTGKYMEANVGAELFSQLEARGISFPVYVLITAASSLFYAPILNMFLGLGEEIGWRGFLYPQLKARFGRRMGRLLGGVIWGAWHWPLIWLMGFGYGAAAGNSAGYMGFPVTGMLAFCVITTGWGVIHDWLYEKSGSIWVPALYHGAINAAVNLPSAVCLPDTSSARLLGPTPVGLLAGLPMLILALALLLRNEQPSETKQ